MPNGRFAYAHLLNTHLTPLRRLFLDRSPPHFLSAAAPRRFEAGVCKQTSGGHLPSFRAAPRILDLPRFGGRVVESIYSGVLMLLLRLALGFSVPGFLSLGTSNAVCRVSGRSFAVC